MYELKASIHQPVCKLEPNASVADMQGSTESPTHLSQVDVKGIKAWQLSIGRRAFQWTYRPLIELSGLLCHPNTPNVTWFWIWI